MERLRRRDRRSAGAPAARSTTAPTPVHPLDDVLPGEARVFEAAHESLRRERRGVRGLWPFLGPAFVAAVAYVDPGNFATNMAGGAQFGYLLLWVDPHGEPDGDGDPVDEREARDRHRG